MDRHDLIVAVLQHTPSQTLLACERVSRALQAGVASETVWYARWLAEEEDGTIDDLLQTWRERVCVAAALRQIKREQRSTACVILDSLGKEGWVKLVDAIHLTLAGVHEHANPFSMEWVPGYGSLEEASVDQLVTQSGVDVWSLRLQPAAAQALAALVGEDMTSFLGACMVTAVHRAHAAHDGGRFQRDDPESETARSETHGCSFYPVVGSRDVKFCTASAQLLPPPVALSCAPRPWHGEAWLTSQCSFAVLDSNDLSRNDGASWVSWNYAHTVHRGPIPSHVSWMTVASTLSEGHRPIGASGASWGATRPS